MYITNYIQWFFTNMILFIAFKKLRGGVPAAVRLLVSPHGYDSSQRKFSSQTSELRAHVHGQFCHHVNHGSSQVGTVYTELRKSHVL